MSFVQDCPSCQLGDHTEHNHDWGLMPDLLGGAVCDCKGDCAYRFKVRVEGLRAAHISQGGVNVSER